jgi:hypothetical protein
MRRSLVRSSGTAFFVGLVALTAAGGVIAEAAELEEVAAADSQTSPAGVPDSNAGRRNLNTVPEDGLDVGSTMGPNKRHVYLARRTDRVSTDGCSEPSAQFWKTSKV